MLLLPVGDVHHISPGQFYHTPQENSSPQLSGQLERVCALSLGGCPETRLMHFSLPSNISAYIPAGVFILFWSPSGKQRNRFCIGNMSDNFYTD